MAIAAGRQADRQRRHRQAGQQHDRAGAVRQQFPRWFAGIAFAAIGIGALVPAAIMSIAAANLWTRNIYKEYLKRDATPTQEARQAKIASLVVKFGAVLFILFIDPQFSIDLQLIGGVIILQTLPAVAHRPLHPLAAPVGAGRRLGGRHGLRAATCSSSIPNPATGKAHFGGSALHAGQADALRLAPVRGLAGADLRRLRRAGGQPGRRGARHPGLAGGPRSREGEDATHPADYHADEGSERLRPVATAVAGPSD